MADYLPGTRDHKFIFNEWLDMDRVFALERYKDFSKADVDMIVDQINKVAKEIIGPSNADGDTIQAQFKDGEVKVPQSLHKAYWFVQENGWGSSNENKKETGNLPQSLQMPVFENIYGANPSLAGYITMTSGSVKLIQSFGTEKDKDMFCAKMFSGHWTGTMSLTEPGGGSDIGDNITKAFPTDDPRVFKIKGTKCFITAGNQDISENIVHMVLARVDGAAPGTKGLSLFMVPKIWVNEDGSLGESNDVTTVGIEHKMGFRASATCVLNFGENDSCRGIILGNPPDAEGQGEGIAQMFQMMNGARYRTGLSAMAVASSAYALAVQYARERIQGRLYTNPKAGRVTIIKHEDIRRLLLNSKAIIESQRALIAKTSMMMDIADYAESAEERIKAKAWIDVTTPIIKAFCSDLAWQVVADCIQVFGGYGFCEDYGVAQCARDVKIFSLYEGTNYIQSQDLVNRKFRMNGGKAFDTWLNEIWDSVTKAKKYGGFDKEVIAIEKALSTVIQIRKWFKTQGEEGGNRALIPLYSTRTLHCCGYLACSALILDQAVRAAQTLAEIGTDHYDYPFYKGKVETARYFIHNLLPNLIATWGIISDADTSAIDIPEEAF